MGTYIVCIVMFGAKKCRLEEQEQEKEELNPECLQKVDRAEWGWCRRGVEWGWRRRIVEG